VSRRPGLVVCMGVSGAGKTTVARHLASELGLHFIEADDFHGEANRAQMAAGKPLDDAMRDAWVGRLCVELDALCERNRDCVLACSGLRQAHRQRFRELPFRTRFLYLSGDRQVISDRLQRRSGHFFPPSLLDSQFADLEIPEDEADVVSLDIGDDLPVVLTAASRVAGEFLDPRA
jgi:gluconokinase